MLLNNVNTQGQTVNLGQGVYQVNLFNLETIDPLDYIRIIGSNFQWRYQGETDWREPYQNNEFTEYADNINQGLIIELNVLEQTELTFRTDDTFEYPNDDTPTNPIIDIEILQAGDYSSIVADGIGAIDNNILSTGEGAVSVEEIQSTYGTEGSYATWSDLENGIYEITYSLYASENDFNHDNIYFYDGTNLNLFDSRSSATIQSSATRWISETKTQEVAITDGQLTFITLDTVDKSGTTQLRINGIERVNDLVDNTNDPYSYIYEEPPFPMPDLGKDLGNDPLTGLNLGTLKPWETDSNTGTEYNQGYVYGSYHLGASYITENIGGDDVSDWIQFNLDESSYLNFYHNNAIAQILDENQQVIIGSDDGYSGNLQAYLNSGNYYIGFSSESSTSELFNASIYLSNSDPNYAD